jgi:alpha-galactosidase
VHHRVISEGINVRLSSFSWVAVSLVVCSWLPAFSFAENFRIGNRQFSVAVRNEDGAYEVHSPDHLVLRSIIGAEVNHEWLKSSKYPRHSISRSSFRDTLGQGQQLRVTFSGLVGLPSLSYILRIYNDLPFGNIQVQVRSSVLPGFAVEHIRCVEAVGDLPLDLAGPDSSDRVLSDSYSEGRLHIYDLEQAPQGLHFAVGSQLIYNRQSKESLFLGALTANKFLSIFRLQAGNTSKGARVISYSVDSGGTTEVRFTDPWRRTLPPSERIQLSVPLLPGQGLSSERLMFAVGTDYHAQLEQYGGAIRQLHNARVNSDNLMGWWSWTAYYTDINEGNAYTNAQWLAQHLKDLGYKFFHLDEGFAYSRGEYSTPDASKFPHGIRNFSSEISQQGLNLGLWVAPLQVGARAWVAQNHKDWLLRNSRGQPLWSQPQRNEGRLYVLDATNPHAQEYLRQTFQTLTREWGARYIKLDFMDLTAVEGFYYRPHTTALEAQRIALQTIRDAVGENVLLDKDGSPMLTPVGIVDEGRISGDTKHSFKAWKDRALGLMARYYMHRNFFVSDPDAFTLQKEIPAGQIDDENTARLPLTLSEAQMTVVSTALTGGMFEIGDDLPTLASEPERMALVTNPDVLQIVKLSHAARPIDLLEYAAEDEQPSISLLREDDRQSIIAVFNWTDKPRSHSVPLSALELADGHDYDLYDVLTQGRGPMLKGNVFSVDDQPPHSVKLIKIVDRSVAARIPNIVIETPTSTKVGETAVLVAKADPNGVPAIDYRWDFGDGVITEGARTSHTYTFAGDYKVRLKVDGIDGLAAEKEFQIAVQGSVALAPPARYEETLTKDQSKDSHP